MAPRCADPRLRRSGRVLALIKSWFSRTCTCGPTAYRTRLRRSSAAIWCGPTSSRIWTVCGPPQSRLLHNGRRPQTLAAPPTGLTASLAGEKPPHRAQLTCSGRQRRSCATPALRARSLVRWSRVLSGHKRCLASGYWELFDCYCVVAARSAAGSEGVSMEETRRQEARRAHDRTLDKLSTAGRSGRDDWSLRQQAQRQRCAVGRRRWGIRSRRAALCRCATSGWAGMLPSRCAASLEQPLRLIEALSHGRGPDGQPRCDHVSQRALQARAYQLGQACGAAAGLAKPAALGQPGGVQFGFPRSHRSPRPRFPAGGWGTAAGASAQWSSCGSQWRAG